MPGFADRLIQAVRTKGNPCVVGLDPRVESMPESFTRGRTPAEAIVAFHERVIEAVAPIVPAVKPQIAFFEQHGVEGLHAYARTVATAREAGLLVIADAKRNDIGSTAAAYAQAFLAPGGDFEADALTVSPYLGRDSLEPFAQACAEHGKGIFVLVKTSNPGSAEMQGEGVSERVARMVDELAGTTSGYGPVGAVVGATYPEEARALRALMPRAIVLVPGYGAQGGTARDAVASFDANGLGALVNASRSITYAFGDRTIDEDELVARVRENAQAMADDLNAALCGAGLVEP